MDCAEEVSLLRRRLSRLTGIYDLAFDIGQGRMTVEFDPARLSVDDVRKAVAAAGMRCDPWREPGFHAQVFWGRHFRGLLTALSGLFLAAAVLSQGFSKELLLSLLTHAEGRPEQVGALTMGFYLLSIGASLIHLLPKALGALRHLRLDMNVLMLASITGAGFLREWLEGATLAFLFALANLLESWSLARARSAIAALVRVAPREATLVHGDHEHRLPVSDITVGSVVRVRPGERIPCEGVVLKGRSFADQALITGESVPVPKEPGDPVYAGTLNADGMLEIRVDRQAADTTLARIARMVQGSQQRRAPSEQFVEKFARYYTPAMFLLAALVGTVPPLFEGQPWGHWFYHAMVILLISCPCALVISTPVSVISALTAAARLGVLVKGGAYLEEAARLRAIAFDKTGVLTLGEPRVHKLVPLNGRSSEAVLRRLAALEMGSEHPLARAIIDYSYAQGIPPAAAAHFEALQGRGAVAEIGGADFWAGSLRMVAEKELDTAELRARVGEIEGPGGSVVACGSDDELWGLIGLTDPIRPEAAAAITGLRRDGMRHVAMLTGDNEPTAKAVARQVGVEDVRAELLPEDKARAVEQMLGAHGKVAMIGDGVNDAQAMAVASLGIALGGKSADVALETADVVLMSGDLHRLPFLVRHARRTVAVIRQNIFLALVLKGGFLALALAGMATLWMAVAADMGATLLVTFNGLRLLRVPAADRA